jgi:hypothetical protein
MCYNCVNFCYHLRFRVWETGLTDTYQALYKKGSMDQWYSIFSLVAEVLLLLQTKTTLVLVLQLPDYCPTLPDFAALLLSDRDCHSLMKVQLRLRLQQFGGRPWHGRMASEVEEGPMCGFSQTVEMVSVLPPMASVTNFSTASTTAKGPLYCKAAKEVANCRLY